MFLNDVLTFATEYKDALIGLGVFFTAIIAFVGAVASAWIAARNARRTHISSLWEKWISELRDDLSELLSLRIYKRRDDIYTVAERRDLNARYSSTYERILLRLNEAEEEHKKLIEALDGFTALIKSDDPPAEAYREAVLQIRICARRIMRIEWKRAVKGK